MRAYSEQVDNNELGTVFIQDKKTPSQPGGSSGFVNERKVLKEYKKISAPSSGKLLLKSLADVEVLFMEMDGRDITVDLIDTADRTFNIVMFGYEDSALILPKQVMTSGYKTDEENRINVHEGQIVIVKITKTFQGNQAAWYAEVDGETDNIVTNLKWGNTELKPDSKGIVTIPIEEIERMIDEQSVLYWNN